jgi:hypothetical protein
VTQIAPVRWTSRAAWWGLSALILVIALCDSLGAQTRPRRATSAPSDTKIEQEKIQVEMQSRFDQAIKRGVEHLLNVQEGQTKAEWPYEGVYRVGGEIPIGYRIGGTAICAIALIKAPGYTGDQSRQQAVARAAKFVVDQAHDPLMNPEYDGGYDVRGWGYTYGLALLLQLKSNNAVPAEIADSIEATITYYIGAIETTEIHTIGGWNYARSRGKDAVSPTSPFMTAPTLLVLFEARKQGYAVDQAVVKRALDTLDQARTPVGSFRYSGINGQDSSEPVPGAVGRMLASETTLFLAGRSSIGNIRGALDAFIVHWEWLNKRRSQTGTHMPPYNIAPYYFYYAHYFAAQTVELLPQGERAEYRRRINELLFSVRLPDGTWNDRVFTRSSNYGTAMAMLATMMPQATTPPRWEVAAGDDGSVRR